MANSVNYDINYDDKRFVTVQSDKSKAIAASDKMYDNMIKESDKYYQAQIDASKQWAEQQKQLQQEQTDFTIEQIEQQKEQETQDYTKEQSGAYVDWQKQSNQYGANAEQMAAQGMVNTGFAESSQVSMYNTYQNRVATARESYKRAILNYDNAIKDARLQNNAALAEIAYNALKEQLELSLQGFQYKNTLVMAKADKRTELDNTYYGRYQDVLKQINTENSLAEEVRQYNEKMAEEKRQYNASLALEKEALQLDKDKFAYQKAQDAAAKIVKTMTKSANSPSNSKISKKTQKLIEDAAAKVGKTKEELPVDMQSVLDLGFGPISASRLDELVSSGVIEEYESNGKLKYKKSASTLKQSMLFK